MKIEYREGLAPRVIPYKKVKTKAGKTVEVLDESNAKEYGMRKVNAELTNWQRVREEMLEPDYVEKRVAEVDEQIATLNEIKDAITNDNKK